MEKKSDTRPSYAETAAAHNNGLIEIYEALNNSEECKEDESETEAEVPSLASILNRPIAHSAQFTSYNWKSYRKDPLDSDDDEYDFAGESSDTSSDDGKRFLLKKAIGIDPEAIQQYDLKSAPENGSQYLMAVRNHNRKVPKVVTADPKLLEERIRKKTKTIVQDRSDENKSQDVQNKTDDKSTSSDDEGLNDSVNDVSDLQQSSRVANRDTEETCPLEVGFLSSLLPDADWTNIVLSDFVKLRAKVNRLRSRIEMRKVIVDLPENIKLPDDNNHVIWQRFCLGTYLSKRLVTKNLFPHIQLKEFLSEFFSGSPSDDPELLDSTENQETFGEEHDSVNSSGKSPVNRAAHFPLLSIVLNIDQRSMEWLIKSHMSWFKCPGLLHSLQAKWIYALLVCIQEPLEANVVSDIREIAKKCIIVRSKLFKLIEKSPSQLRGVNKEELLKYVAILTLFILLVSKYFGQRDLSEESCETL